MNFCLFHVCYVDINLKKWYNITIKTLRRFDKYIENCIRLSTHLLYERMLVMRTKKGSMSVDRMMKYFHNDFNNGLEINEIAKKYKINKSTVYKKLEKIAKTNGVSRDYYIRNPQMSHKIPAHDTKNSYEHYTDDDLKNINASFDNIVTDIVALREKIENNVMFSNKAEKE